MERNGEKEREKKKKRGVSCQEARMKATVFYNLVS